MGLSREKVLDFLVGSNSKGAKCCKCSRTSNNYTANYEATVVEVEIAYNHQPIWDAGSEMHCIILHLSEEVQTTDHPEL